MAKDEILRTDYLEKLMRYKDLTDLIKVIAGMRRCGKSTLLKQFRNELIKSGIDKKNVIHINLDSKANRSLLNEDALYDHLISKSSKERTYILLDEVQNVTGWERVVDSLLIDADADVYITGSNAYMLSTELSTYLTGRTVTINMLPLSFKEFKELNRYEDDEKAFNEYISVGSMPIIRKEMSKDDMFEIIGAIRSDIIVKDIARRNKLTDVAMLERMIDYLFSEIGNQISGHSISKELKVDNKTADNYLKMIRESLMFHQVKRYDLEGKIILTTPSKYYCTDLGMRNASIGEHTRNIGRSIEDVVFLELLRRGYSVRTGRTGDTEIDFVADKGGTKEYYQVAKTLLDDKVERREKRPLDAVNDGKRTILTTDRIGIGTYAGIEYANVMDWLLGKK